MPAILGPARSQVNAQGYSGNFMRRGLTSRNLRMICFVDCFFLGILSFKPETQS